MSGQIKNVTIASDNTEFFLRFSKAIQNNLEFYGSSEQVWSNIVRTIKSVFVEERVVP
jgi:hypothetical protein